MQIVRIGMDIAKNVLQVHGVDAHGKVVVRKQLSRSKVLVYFAKLPGCRGGDRSLRQRPLLGTGVAKTGTRRAVDGGATDQTVSHQAEE
jgi:transposase